MSLKRQRSVALLLLATVSSVGCQNSVAPVQIESRPVPGLAVQSADFGEVELRVRWPQFVQAIPYSANSLVVVAFDGLGRVADQVVLTRNDSPNSLSSASMRLRAGTYTIEARAYREATPSLMSEPTSMGSAPNIEVKTNLKTSFALTLNAVEPTLGALSSAAGGVGSAFTIDTVKFFGRAVTASDIVEVYLGQMTPQGPISPYRTKATVSIEPRRSLDPLTTFNRLVDAEQDMIRVIVPQGIKGECKVWLRVDGVEVDAGTFRVVDRMAFDRSTLTHQVGESFHGKAQLKAYALDTVSALSFPILTWSSSAPAVAFVTSGGVIHAYRPGTTVITARSGQISASFNFVATDRHSTASIAVDLPDLGTGAVSVPLEIPAYSGDDVGTVTH